MTIASIFLSVSENVEKQSLLSLGFFYFLIDKPESYKWMHFIYKSVVIVINMYINANKRVLKLNKMKKHTPFKNDELNSGSYKLLTLSSIDSL